MVGRTSKADVAQSAFLNRQFAVVVDETDLLTFYVHSNIWRSYEIQH